jgi:hypothetical protein
MREISTNNRSTADFQERSQGAAKSLFPKILAITLFDSRFYEDRTRYPRRKVLGMSILDKESKKNVRSIQPRILVVISYRM